MRKIISAIGLAALAALPGSGPAAAADMVVPYVAPTAYTPAPVRAWDGIFVGIFAGGGFGQAYHLTGPMNNIVVSGVLAGASVGANMYVTDSIVAGVEADLAWGNVAGSTAAGGGTSTHTFNWMGTARAVLGYDAGMFLPYVTGGAAFVNGTRSSSVGPQPNNASATHFGYAVGAGVQMAVTDSIVVDLRYLYSEYFPAVYDWSGVGTNPTIGPEVNTVTLGVKMPIN